jgi:hypothetical protein
VVAFAAASNGVIIRTQNGGYSFAVEQSFYPMSSGVVMQCLGVWRGNTMTVMRGQRAVAADNAGGIYVKGSAPSMAPTYTPTVRPSQEGDTNPPTLAPTLRPTAGPLDNQRISSWPTTVPVSTRSHMNPPRTA